MSYDRIAIRWYLIESNLKLIYRNHLASLRIKLIELNTRVLCASGPTIRINIVGHSNQLALLVGIVPVTQLDNVAFVVVLSHIAHIAILHVYYHIVARNLLHTVTIHLPTITHVAKELAHIRTRQHGINKIRTQPQRLVIISQSRLYSNLVKSRLAISISNVPFLCQFSTPHRLVAHCCKFSGQILQHLVLGVNYFLKRLNLIVQFIELIELQFDVSF